MGLRTKEKFNRPKEKPPPFGSSCVRGFTVIIQALTAIPHNAGVRIAKQDFLSDCTKSPQACCLPSQGIFVQHDGIKLKQGVRRVLCGIALTAGEYPLRRLCFVLERCTSRRIGGSCDKPDMTLPILSGYLECIHLDTK